MINPGAELIQLGHPVKPSLPQIHQVEPVQVHRIQYVVPTIRPHRFHTLINYERPISLASDIDVNFKPEKPPINPDSEFVDVTPQQQQQHRPAAVNKAVNYVSVYRYGTGGYSYQLSS